ncbi:MULTISPECIES: hypothetical protein [Halorubrum]|jgi:hypothetical protein|uniref:Uncharacterized protein n=1 Tax=Halorubrum ezzemoulense TaxID=337243 RepID=A0A256IVV0_HALEZ|nr:MULTISPECIES: hypothetical protein [Halorubrum]MDB2236408.1 hypothetical protein [Halorubrum ezzemoulense]MDB2248304.1 hypothetical protein [Halorubrum ezzemoulense]MDB9279241.1 hypothetical protein [Halorubrum ezzemoulense]MDB9282763.1 hypothetical protein [Halorubrum ezzemoulense]OYR60645.1 hypothetical protein DJ80_14835 [Halorubrum ezzemoulense]
MAETGDAPDDSVRERADRSRVALWLLLDADRRLVTAVILSLVFLGLVAAGAVLPGAAETLRRGDSVDTLFQGLLTATITGVTLVLTLNQLVLSQELGAVGDQRERMDGAMAFRDDAAAVLGEPVSPAEPAAFLGALVRTASDRATALREAVSGTTDAELARATDDLTDAVAENAARTTDGLDGAQFGAFEVISAVLDFNYSWKLFAARRLRERHGEALNETAAAALDDLIETLRLFGPAREHFKTLYFQWELIDLSRRMLVSAVPALLTAAAMVAFFDAERYAGSILGVEAVAFWVALAAAVSLVPFALLLAYILRIATVTKRTLSVGPFILRETDGEA